MRYCRTCKLRAADADTVCRQCGGPLATLGAAPGATATGADASVPIPLGLQGQMRALEAQQQRNLALSRSLLVACGLLAAALLMILYVVYRASVLSYARLDNVQLEQDERQPARLRVRFDVATPGRVSFDRRSGGEHTEKIDVYNTRGPVELTWEWPSDPQTGIDFAVHYRAGWTRTAQRQHFDVTLKPTMADIVFLLDTTSSMRPFIDGLKRKCIDFADSVRRQGVDCQLGLIGFGDVELGEPLRVYPPTSSTQDFQTNVGTLPRTGGGDDDESSVDALERALDMKFRPGATVCFVHITDASTHRVQDLSAVEYELKQRGIVTYVVSQRQWERVYGKLCINGGSFFAIEDAQFETILDRIGSALVSRIGYAAPSGGP